MGVLLPTATVAFNRLIGRTTIVIGGVQCEVECLPSRPFVPHVARRRGIHGQHGAIRREDAAPRVAIVVLLATHWNTQPHGNKAAVDKLDQCLRIALPIRIEFFTLLEQVVRQFSGAQAVRLSGSE